MSIVNGRIQAQSPYGISLDEVISVIGDGYVLMTDGTRMQDVGACCRSSRVNKWARCKPYRVAGVIAPLTATQRTLDANGNGANMGFRDCLVYASGTEGQAPTTLVTQLYYTKYLFPTGTAAATQPVWQYEQPRGLYNSLKEYYRLHDFDGYLHTAHRPWAEGSELTADGQDNTPQNPIELRADANGDMTFYIMPPQTATVEIPSTVGSQTYHPCCRLDTQAGWPAAWQDFFGTAGMTAAAGDNPGFYMGVLLKERGSDQDTFALMAFSEKPLSDASATTRGLAMDITANVQQWLDKLPDGDHQFTAMFFLAPLYRRPGMRHPVYMIATSLQDYMQDVIIIDHPFYYYHIDVGGLLPDFMRLPLLWRQYATTPTPDPRLIPVSQSGYAEFMRNNSGLLVSTGTWADANSHRLMAIVPRGLDGTLLYARMYVYFNSESIDYNFQVWLSIATTGTTLAITLGNNASDIQWDTLTLQNAANVAWLVLSNYDFASQQPTADQLPRLYAYDAAGTLLGSGTLGGATVDDMGTPTRVQALFWNDASMLPRFEATTSDFFLRSPDAYNGITVEVPASTVNVKEKNVSDVTVAWRRDIKLPTGTYSSASVAIRAEGSNYDSSMTAIELWLRKGNGPCHASGLLCTENGQRQTASLTSQPTLLRVVLTPAQKTSLAGKTIWIDVRLS